MGLQSRPASEMLGPRLDTDGIIDRVPKPLFTSQVALGGLNANVPEQELNLLQFSA